MLPFRSTWPHAPAVSDPAFESSRLAIVPRLRTSPSGSAIATAIVSAWTSKPKNRNFSLMTGSFRCSSGLCFLKQTQPNPRSAHRAGHAIMTRDLGFIYNYVGAVAQRPKPLLPRTRDKERYPEENDPIA